MTNRTMRKIDVCVLPCLISDGPIIACSNLSPGSPGIGSINPQPTIDSPTPAIPVGCNHCSLISDSPPIQDSTKYSVIRFVSNTVGAAVSSGGSLGVIISPNIVRILPEKNRTSGTDTSIEPSARLFGIGIRSGFLCPSNPTIPKGHHVGIGKTIGEMCPTSTPNFLATITLQ